MEEWSRLEKDVLLKGELLIVVRARRDGRPRAGQQVTVLGCGFV